MNIIRKNLVVMIMVIMLISMGVTGGFFANAAGSLDELYRPQLHYSPSANWMNDPNGLVYNATTGEYNMYYQYCNTLKEDQSQKCWGHAVSKDLVHWQEKAIAIMPDDLGSIWSGSAVIDSKNTSGLFDDNTPPESRMVAFYTYAGGDTTYGYEKQGMAYSKDNGNTWVKYTKNPIIASVKNGNAVYEGGFRDPKVTWYEDSSYANGGVWLMVIAGGDARLFTSENLVDWKYNSTLKYKDKSKINSECPDFYQIKVENSNETKWVFSGAGRFYVVGALTKGSDGVFLYNAETEKQSFVNDGTDLYASQTFFNDPHGRRVAIYWMIDLYSKQMDEKAGKVWDGVQSLAMELKLYKTTNSYEIKANPVEEIKTLRKTDVLFHAENLIMNDSVGNVLSGITGDQLEIEFTCSVKEAEKLFLNVRCGDKTTGSTQKTVVRYDVNKKSLILSRSKTGIVNGSTYTVNVEPDENGKIKFRVFVDRSVLDVFVNDGEYSLNALIFPDKESLGVELYAEGGEAVIDTITVYKLSSIWEDYEAQKNVMPQQTETPQNIVIEEKNNMTTYIIIGIIAVVSVAVCSAIILSSRKKSK